MRVSGKFITAATRPGRLFARRVDGNNYYYLDQSTTALAIYKVVAGVETLLQSTLSVPLNDDVYVLEVFGQSLRYLKNDVQIGTTVIDTGVTGAGGSAFFSFGVGWRIDDFGVEEIPAGGTYDDRWRARPSVLTSGTSTLGTKRSAYPEDAQDGGLSDAVADYRSRDV